MCGIKSIFRLIVFLWLFYSLAALASPRSRTPPYEYQVFVSSSYPSNGVFFNFYCALRKTLCIIEFKMFGPLCVLALILWPPENRPLLLFGLWLLTAMLCLDIDLDKIVEIWPDNNKENKIQKAK